jgi:ketosteroid isomerase-like protein
MTIDVEVHEFLLKHLQAVQDNDLETYKATSAEDLAVYEWWLTPHRIDGLPFHEFMIAADAKRQAQRKHENGTDEHVMQSRFDLANLRIQRYGDSAIASYTLLVSISLEDGERVEAHNESRVMVKLNGIWKVVHVHKSPCWNAPHVAN